MMITINGNQTEVTGPDGRTTATHITEREAAVHALRSALQALGSPSSRRGSRNESAELGPLDASRWRDRASGFVATLGEQRIKVDASGDLPIEIVIGGGQ